jgi:predicted DNA-binding transcriptional regulator AlpA
MAAKFPSIKLVRQPEVCEALGIVRITLDRWVRGGAFPAPIRISEKTYAWRLADVEAWIAQRSRSRKRRKPRGSLMQGDELVVMSPKLTKGRTAHA